MTVHTKVCINKYSMTIIIYNIESLGTYHIIVYYTYMWLNENYACKSQYLRNIHICTEKHKKDKKSTGKFVPKMFPDMIQYNMFITHDDSSPTKPSTWMRVRSCCYPITLRWRGAIKHPTMHQSEFSV